MTTLPKPTLPDRQTAIVIIGIVLVGLNLRPGIVSIAPVLELIRVDLEMSYAVVSFLTAIPVFCIGLFALGTPIIHRKLGSETGVFWGVILIGIATGLRIFGDIVAILFITTVLVGVGIAVTQTLLPSIVKSYLENHVAFATGLYTASLSLGAALTSALTVPAAGYLGSWTAGLAIWGLLAVGAVIVWFKVLRNSQQVTISNPVSHQELSESGGYIPWRNPFAWAMTLVATINVSIYYSMLTWYAPRYVSLGWSEDAAGIILTVFIIAGLLGMLTITVFGDLTPDRRIWMVPMTILAVIGATGIGMAPELFPWGWAVLLGFGIGGWYSLILILPVDYSVHPRQTAKLSSMVIGGGYMSGAIAPFLIGGIRDAVGDFSIAFIGIAVLTLIAMVMSFLFSPHREPISTNVDQEA